MPFRQRILLLLMSWLAVDVGWPSLRAEEPGGPAILPTPRRVGPPVWLPRYDLDMRVDVSGHEVRVRQRVTWTNRYQCPARELVFNAHSYYQVPAKDIGIAAKTLELLRISPQEGLDTNGHALDIQTIRVWEPGQESHVLPKLPFRFEGDTGTTLVVSLPMEVLKDQSLTVEMDLVLRLPQKQGRWGQWDGVTFLSNWLPVLAIYDEKGWQPTPFIPWHQPFFNEAGVYNARVLLPGDQKVACTGTILAQREMDNGWKQLDIAANGVRDFAFLCSARYREYTGAASRGPHLPPVRVHCLAFPEHEFYARAMIRTACEVIPVYGQWIGPYPYPDYTIAESYFGWNGNECSTLVMIDERIFAMPHVGSGFVEQLITHETCHQWFYNLIGTNGYCETWMDEAWATYYSHRFLDGKYGRNSSMMRYPNWLEWLPNISRDTYRYYTFYGVLARGEMSPIIQEMPKFGHIVNLFGMCYDKGSKVVGMIVDRLGDVAFIDFMHHIYKIYGYRILRVAAFQRELERYTGRSWDEFFQRWLYNTGLTDWAIEKVVLERLPSGEERRHHWRQPFPKVLQGRLGPKDVPYAVSVLLHQKAEYNEPTVLGFCLDTEGQKEHYPYQIRVPILPQSGVVELDEPLARIHFLPHNRVRVDVLLPSKPVQIEVDPDQVLVDRNPANNRWLPHVRWQITPLYTFLNETDMTTSYDRWNVGVGPWMYGATYNDAWYTRATMVGFRAGAYRTQDFAGGAYAAYRTSYRDVVAGVDGLWSHLPWPQTQIGFNLERRLETLVPADSHPNRAVLFGRYIFQNTSSLYKRPMHFVEIFTSAQDNFLPYLKNPIPGGERYTYMANGGIHYHINYLTPYWNAAGGFQFDITYAGGVVGLDQQHELNEVNAQFSTVRSLPDFSYLVDNGSSWGDMAAKPLRWLADTRLAMRVTGAGGLPLQGEYFALGGDQMFRGFSMGERQGSALWLASLEWRVPLAQHLNWDVCDHVTRLRNIYGAFFYDVGDVYVNGHSFGPVAQGLGAGLRLEVSWFGFVERTIFRFDAAKAINSTAPAQMWFGIQQPF